MRYRNITTVSQRSSIERRLIQSTMRAATLTDAIGAPTRYGQCGPNGSGSSMIRGNSGSPAAQTYAATKTRVAIKTTLRAIAAGVVPLENRLLGGLSLDMA